MWVPAALRSVGVSDGVGSLYPCGLLFCTLVRPLLGCVPTVSTAGSSPLPPPRTAGYR